MRLGYQFCFLITFFPYLINPICSTLYLPKQFNLKQFKENVSPENTQLAFDIHDVLVSKQKLAMCAIILKNKRTSCAFAFNISWEYLSYLWTGTKGFLLTSFELLNGKSYEAYVKRFQEQHPNLAHVIEQLSLQYEPTKNMNKLLEQLPEYEKRLASDIGSTFFKKLKKKSDCCHLFKHFKGGQVIAYSNASQKQTSITTTKSAKAHLDGKFFEKYVRHNNPNNKQVIFIDDNQRYVKLAQRMGIIGIHFKNSKQLNANLIQLGLL